MVYHYWGVKDINSDGTSKWDSTDMGNNNINKN